MARRYRGDGCVSRFLAEADDSSTCIKVKMKPADMHFFTKIMEAYCHLVFLSPVKPKEGIIALFATPDNMPQVREIVENFPLEVEIINN